MSRILPLHTDPAKDSARAAELHYVRNDAPGIARIGKHPSFSYRKNGKPVRDAATLDRIRLLAIPPAWTDVWICADASGHLQATGFDVKGRKQYRYHAKWSAIRSRTKYVHALDLGRQLPRMRKRLSQDLARPGLPLEKVLAAVVSVMEHTQIRVGHDVYAKENGTFGLSTLKDRHVRKDGQGVRFIFKGKTGINHNIRLGSARLAKLVMRCKELPGQDLFQYLDAEGEPHPIGSGMVNEYIRTITGGSFTSKDIRTWKGTVYCTQALLAQPPASSATECARVVNAALDEVARHLGNTRTVSRKYYVHPEVIRAYEQNKLHGLAADLRATRHMPLEERLVMRLLSAKGSSRAAGKAA